MGIRLPDGPDPVAGLDPELVNAARGIGFAVGARLRELAPSLRPSNDAGAEPDLVIEEIALDPDDPLDPLTLIACLQAHDAYVVARGRPGAASPGALALARVLAWAARAEMLGRAPGIAWIGPPGRRPDGLAGHAVTATVTLLDGDTRIRAAAVAVVA
ncbi:MAG: hypothetical protein FJW92_00220 [Actinobacteria bacterium]|nr:hypothetical protein [Actinomycetota bacterium]